MEAARQWLQTHMPGDVTAAREARNRMILALNREGFNNRVIADAVECSEWTVRDTLRGFLANGESVQRNDPRGGSRQRPQPVPTPSDTWAPATPERGPVAASEATPEPANVVDASERFQPKPPTVREQIQAATNAMLSALQSIDELIPQEPEYATEKLNSIKRFIDIELGELANEERQA